MTTLTLCEADDLTDAETDALWAQGVNLDDWDYLLVCEDTARFRAYVGIDAEGYSIRREIGDGDGSDAAIAPKDWSVGRLLVGCCSNVWYLADFRGRRCAIGVAYHA